MTTLKQLIKDILEFTFTVSIGFIWWIVHLYMLGGVVIHVILGLYFQTSLPDPVWYIGLSYLFFWITIPMVLDTMTHKPDEKYVYNHKWDLEKEIEIQITDKSL